MGIEVCRAMEQSDGIELVAAVDRSSVGTSLSALGVGANEVRISDDPQSFLDASVQVVVDFTVLDAARENVAWCARNGLHAVVGTTGFTEDDLASIAASFERSGCLIAANFAISAVLMMKFAEEAAPYFETVEIIELHHDQKVDAPSGTALATASRIAAASTEWAPDPTTNEVVPGARGGKTPDGITVHSVRLRGLVAHQEVLFGTTGQSLTIRQDSYDRSSFMPGVVLAVRAMEGRTGLTTGLEAVL